MADDRIYELAEITVAVLDHQLNLADKTWNDVKYHRWPLGYCFGSLDAIGQHYGLGADCKILIAVGFNFLASDRREAERYVARCIDIQGDRFFAEGREHGGDDFIQWQRTKGDFKPLTLMNFFAFGQPPALRELR